MSASINEHPDDEPRTLRVQTCAQPRKGVLVCELNKTIRRHYPGNLKGAAAAMKFKSEQRLAKQVSAETLEDVETGLGEHTSLQRIEELPLKAIQDWLAGSCRRFGLEVVLTRRQTQEQLRDLIDEIGLMNEKAVRIYHSVATSRGGRLPQTFDFDEE